MIVAAFGQFGRYDFQPVGMVVEQVVDVSASFEQFIRDHQRGHQHEPLVADWTVFKHQRVEGLFDMVSQALKTISIRIAAIEAVAALVEA